MNAPAYQPVPTIAQRRALAADHAKRYREVQAIADFQAARLRYEERQPEPCQFCAEPDEDEHLTWPRLIVSAAAGLILWAFIGWACAPFLAPFIALLQRVAP